MQTALDSLSTINGTNAGSVTVTTSGNAYTYVVTFQGALAQTSYTLGYATGGTNSVVPTVTSVFNSVAYQLDSVLPTSAWVSVATSGNSYTYVLTFGGSLAGSTQALTVTTNGGPAATVTTGGTSNGNDPILRYALVTNTLASSTSAVTGVDLVKTSATSGPFAMGRVTGLRQQPEREQRDQRQTDRQLIAHRRHLDQRPAHLRQRGHGGPGRQRI